MKPRLILVAALLLIVVVVAAIVAWASFGDRPGPMGSTVLDQRAEQLGPGSLLVMLKDFEEKISLAR